MIGYYLVLIVLEIYVMDINNWNTTKVGQSMLTRKKYAEILVSKLSSCQRPA